MEDSTADLFQVYVREHRYRKDSPEKVERPLAVCATYEEARRIRQEHLRADSDCVIRYLGNTGGGD
jgi:hypothetical protein